jgi:hypothetical protein
VKSKLLNEYLFRATSPVHLGHFVDPDELDLLLAFRKKYGEVKGNAIVNWQDRWEYLREDLLQKMPVIPTFTDTSDLCVEFETYIKRRHKDVLEQTIIQNVPEMILATYINQQFRIITNDLAIRTKGPAYLLKLDIDDTMHLRFLERAHFELSFEIAPEEMAFSPVYRTVYVQAESQLDEQLIIDYVFSHSEFRDKLTSMLLGEDQREEHILEELLEAD